MFSTTDAEAPALPHGRVERHDRRIKLYDFDDAGLTAGLRAIDVYLPRGYEESDGRYPVVYFNDGGNALSGAGAGRMNADLACDALTDEGLIHPSILVGVGNAGLPGRVKDLSPTVDSGYRGPWTGIGDGGGLEGYYRFLAERLKPFIDIHYRTRADASSTGIAGYSLGGSSAFLMAYAHPETFGMAGCMSPSLWWGDDFALDLVGRDPGGRKPVRFWLDSGGSGGDYPAWRKAARAYEMLRQKGWVPGDDLAAYFDYNADHRFESGAGRMRAMLRFLLREEPLRLDSYRLVCAADPDAPIMDLGAGRRRVVGPEAIYACGLRLTVPRPEITVADTSVVTVDADDPLLLHGVGPGETTISSAFQRRTASLVVVGYDPDAPGRDGLVCPPARATPPDAGDGADLPHTVRGQDGDGTVARFGVCHDADYVYVTVRVEDGVIAVDDGRLPWEQDGVGVRFDARAEKNLRAGQGCTDEGEFLTISLSPRPPGEPPCVFPGPDAWERVVPAGLTATCVPAPGGYIARLSYPTAYLNERQGDGNWTVFRLNLCVSRFDVIGGPGTDAWWQPEWVGFASPIGSGIFRRE